MRDDLRADPGVLPLPIRGLQDGCAAAFPMLRHDAHRRRGIEQGREFRPGRFRGEIAPILRDGQRQHRRQARPREIQGGPGGEAVRAFGQGGQDEHRRSGIVVSQRFQNPGESGSQGVSVRIRYIPMPRDADHEGNGSQVRRRVRVFVCRLGGGKRRFPSGHARAFPVPAASSCTQATLAKGECGPCICFFLQFRIICIRCTASPALATPARDFTGNGFEAFKRATPYCADSPRQGPPPTSVRGLPPQRSAAAVPWRSRLPGA